MGKRPLFRTHHLGTRYRCKTFQLPDTAASFTDILDILITVFFLFELTIRFIGDDNAFIISRLMKSIDDHIYSILEYSTSFLSRLTFKSHSSCLAFVNAEENTPVGIETIASPIIIIKKVNTLPHAVIG